MAYKSIPKEFDLSTKFPTWIIAYCPDADLWFCTKQRFFYFEYPDEFQCKNDAVDYFKNHIDEFIKLNNELQPRKIDCIYLEHSSGVYKVKL